jgi:plasmid stabilization system protein ParE
MRLVWARRALRELKEIEAFFAHASPMTGERVLVQIEASAALIKEFPRIGFEIENRPARMLITGRYRYRLIYETEAANGIVRILRVLHPRQHE